MNMKQTILVAGAGGYIGLPLCERLARDGHRIVAFDRFFFGQPKRIGDDRSLIVRGDVRSIDRDLLQKVDAVVDLSGLSNDPAAMLSNRLSYAVNYEGACHLARTARACGIKRYIYMSSASVYGRCAGEALNENGPCEPQSLYAELKLKVEHELLRLSDATFQPVMLRNATVFGLAPRMRYDLAVNVMTLNAVRQGTINVDGNGLQKRPFIHVRDVAEGVVQALQLDLQGTPERIFNLGSHRLNYGIRDIAEEIVTYLPETQIRYRPQSADTRDYQLDCSRAEHLLGFTAQRTIADGIREIIDHLHQDQSAGNQPTESTAHWYQTLLEWEERLSALRLNGRLL